MRKLSINTKVQRCKQVQVTTQLSTLSKTFIIKLDEITMTQLETIKRENTRPDFLKIKKKMIAWKWVWQTVITITVSYLGVLTTIIREGSIRETALITTLNRQTTQESFRKWLELSNRYLDKDDKKDIL